MKVTVVLSTYNGEKYLKEQIESILNQDIKDLLLYIRDDGSKDNTKKIIQDYLKTGKVIASFEKNIGAKNSFMKAIADAPDAEYMALADQDDIWERNKISTAIKLISKKEYNGKPILYHSALLLADANGNVIGKAGQYNNVGFLNGETRAVTGCTVVFNRSLANMLKEYTPVFYPMHDAWIHNVCLAVNGIIIYDKNSYIKYRQHGNNVVGGSRGLLGSIQRRIKYLKKMERNQNSNMYKEIVEHYSSYMPVSNIERAKKLCLYQSCVKEKWNIMFHESYFNGRIWWKIEQLILVLTNRY